ncbi:MAG TPA: hypothetical protein VK249_16890 [Anaerolineales bacterium]|nr:hypothetical protein [Anaerolineales bacterium]
MDEHPSPEFEKEIRETLNASSADPAFVYDLRATLLEKAKMKQQTRSFSRLAWGVALAILLIGLLVASPSVVEALKRLLGYIPGVGYVEQGGSLRLLSTPVMLEKDGLKLTLEKGAADSGRTILLEHIEGYTPDRYSGQYCDTPARLILPDGTILNQMQYEITHEGGKASPGGSYYGRYIFAAIPAGQLQAVLEIPCLINDGNFRDWRLQLHFQVADATQVMPVIELPTQSTAATPPSLSETVPTQPVVVPASPSGPTLEGFSILLESETPLTDGYILSGSYQWADPRFDIFSVQINDPKIRDANGQQVPFEPVEPLVPVDPAARKLPFAYQISGRNYAWPLTIAVNSITVNLPDQATFQFDAGANPQPGQVWNVNIDVPVAGHVIHVQTIELTAGRTSSQLGFTFTMASDPAVMGANIDDPNAGMSSAGGGGGGDNASAAGPFTYGWALEGYSPAGVKTFMVSNVAVMFNGPWQVAWQPSAK